MAFNIRSLTLSIALLSTLTACGLGVTVATRSMVELLPIKTIPGASVLGGLSLSLGLAIRTPNIDLGVGENIVSFARINGLRLVILDSSEQDSLEDGALDSFDFLTGLDIDIRGVFDGQVVQIPIATLPDGDPQFGTAARSLDLTITSNVDVLDFLLLPGGYEVVLDLEGTIPTDNVVIAGEIEYRVGVGI